MTNKEVISNIKGYIMEYQTEKVYLQSTKSNSIEVNSYISFQSEKVDRIIDKFQKIIDMLEKE